MSFWLQESLLSVYIRGLTLHVQLLATICFALFISGCAIFYKRFLTPERQQERVVMHVLKAAHAKERRRATRKKLVRVSLNPQALPQTLHFFSQAGFYVQGVECLLQLRTKKSVGYAIRVQSSFEVLMKFLAQFERDSPHSQLSVRTIERMSDSKLAVEFLIKGARA
jgi:hypothetical protein